MISFDVVERNNLLYALSQTILEINMLQESGVSISIEKAKEILGEKKIFKFIENEILKWEIREEIVIKNRLGNFNSFLKEEYKNKILEILYDSISYGALSPSPYILQIEDTGGLNFLIYVIIFEMRTLGDFKYYLRN